MSHPLTGVCPKHKNCRLLIDKDRATGRGISLHIPTLEGTAVEATLKTDCGMHKNCDMTMEGGITKHTPRERTWGAPAKSKPVDPRGSIYNGLLNKFAGVNAKLDVETRSELDGLLWDMSYLLASP